MKPLPFVWPYALVFWLVYVWAFWPEFMIVRRARQSARRGDSPDAGSFRVILVGMWIAYLAAFLLAWVRPLQFPPTVSRGVFMAGIALLVGGSLLRRHCWRMLGAAFTGDVQAHAQQQVVTSGAYALVRHPSYTAGILMNAGIGLAFGSWAGAVLLVITSIVAYTYRMAVEERVLLAAIGAPYREFMNSRKRLIPYIY